MTEQQRNTIFTLRASGAAMSEIAEAVCLPVGTVKSFCSRCKAPRTETSAEIHCSYCGAPVIQRSGTAVRHFCDRHCYNKWWHSHNERGRTVYHKQCLHCGRPFDALSKKAQRYCSAACYQAARKGGDAVG